MFEDINGIELRRGRPWQRVAWALTRGGQLSAGTVLDTTRANGGEVLVRREKDGREVWLPYKEQKFVILSYHEDPVPLTTRALEAVRKLTAQGVDIVDIMNVRCELRLPFSDSNAVYMALEELVESGEIKRAAYPRYAYTLA